jgi:hypothetical protein
METENDYGKIKKLLAIPISEWNVDQCIVYLTASDKSQARLKKQFEGSTAAARNAVGQQLKALMQPAAAVVAAALSPSTTELATGSQVVTILQLMAAKTTPQVLAINPIRSSDPKAYFEDLAVMLPLLRAVQAASFSVHAVHTPMAAALPPPPPPPTALLDIDPTFREASKAMSLRFKEEQQQRKSKAVSSKAKAKEDTSSDDDAE